MLSIGPWLLVFGRSTSYNPHSRLPDRAYFFIYLIPICSPSALRLLHIYISYTTQGPISQPVARMCRVSPPVAAQLVAHYLLLDRFTFPRPASLFANQGLLDPEPALPLQSRSSTTTLLRRTDSPMRNPPAHCCYRIQPTKSTAILLSPPFLAFIFSPTTPLRSAGYCRSILTAATLPFHFCVAYFLFGLRL